MTLNLITDTTTRVEPNALEWVMGLSFSVAMVLFALAMLVMIINLILDR